MNFYEGNGFYPTTETKNVQQRLLETRNNPLQNYVLNQYVQMSGQINRPVSNQAIDGGMSYLNPKIQGEIRYQPVVSGKPTNRVLTKYENNRRSSDRREALYDVRNNQSLYGATKIPDNKYLKRLQDQAKQKVVQKNGVNYQFQHASDKPQTFSQYSMIETYASPEFTLNGLDNENGTLNFLSLKEPEVDEISYNPMLASSKGNNSRFNIKPGNPDERMTRYSGERPYVTSGDRKIQAREFATSERVKELSALQKQANNAMKGINRTARQIGHAFGQGIRVNYHDVDLDTDNKLKQNNENLDRVDMSSGEEFRIKKTEHFLPRQTDIKRQQHIQQDVGNYYEPEFKKDMNAITEKDIVRKIHGDNDDIKLFRGYVDESFKAYDEKLNNYHSKNYNKERKEELEQFDKPPESLSIFEKFISLFKKNNPIIGEGRNGDIEKYESDFKHQARLEDRDDADIDTYKRVIRDRLFHVIEKDVQEDYEDEANKKTEVLTKPISVLRLEGNEIVRSIATRTKDGVKLLRIREDQTNGEKFYEIIDIPQAVFDEVIRKKIGTDIRCDKDVLELNYDDHVKINNLAETAPDDFKTISHKPLHFYQREELEEPKEFITNINFDMESRKKEFELDARKHVNHGSRLKGDFNQAYYNKGIQSKLGSLDEHLKGQTKKEVINTQNQKDMKKNIRRFDSDDD